jgi:ABC-type branched-subunit amino acid transport system substrate-binding protein
VPSDKFQGVAAADMVLAAGGKRCVVLAENTPYGYGLSFNFIASYTAKGGQVVGKYEFNRGAGNATAALDLVRRGRADCVFMAMNDLNFAAAFIKAAGAAKLQTKLFAGDSVMDPAMYKLLGADGARLTANLRGINFGLGELVHAGFWENWSDQRGVCTTCLPSMLYGGHTRPAGSAVCCGTMCTLPRHSYSWQ